MTRSTSTEVTKWLEEHWDPALTVRDWWQVLGDSGWAAPTWPEGFGKGLPNADASEVHEAFSAYGALGPPGGIGMVLAGPTILTHGSDEQKRRFLPDIVTGRVAWCQLFSEPNAGSDLAGLQARAVRDRNAWVITGQKVWTSGAHIADLGLLIARTDPDVPKHRGITYFALDMHQAGVEVRPLRELTGRALFNEVFLEDVRVPDDDVIGSVGDGWAVANTTLAFERAGLGASGGGAESSAQPGRVAGHLDRPAGEFIRRSGRRRSSAMFAVKVEPLIEAARRHGRANDDMVRQQLVRLYTEAELGRFMALRQKALRRVGQDVPGFANLAKLRMSQMFRLARDAGLGILGARGMLHDYDGSGGRAAEDPDGVITALGLWSPAPSIYGGTDEVQRNVVAERVLGLPREPGDDRSTPFRRVAMNG